MLRTLRKHCEDYLETVGLAPEFAVILPVFHWERFQAVLKIIYFLWI